MRACLRFACETARGHVCWSLSCGAVLSDFRTAPRSMPLAWSFDLVIRLQPVRENSGTCGRLDLVLNLVSLASHGSQASHVSIVSRSLRLRESARSSVRSLLTPSESCLSISPIQSFTLLNDSLSITSQAVMMSCVLLFRLSTYTGILN